MKPRTVTQTVTGQPTSDGAGVRLTRVLGQAALTELDPFLLLDEFKSESGDDYAGGFPDHPHRGFETVTYMLAGSMEHRDHKGNHGLLRPGSVQWMTAGKGIIHSEMPKQQDGLMWGFQLWVNLPAKDKLGPPRYQDIAPERIPDVTRPDGVRVRVIAGRLGEAEGPVQGVATQPLYLDVRLPVGTRFEHEVPEKHTAFVYVFEGNVGVGPAGKEQELRTGQLGVLADGDSVHASAANGPGRFLLLAGQPLDEPIARYGPFVMNTEAELRQAFDDYQRGTFLG